MNNEFPLVSVIIPSYNHEKFVEESVRAVLEQTYPNIELIVIDDGSKDKSHEILEELSKQFGFYYHQQVNIGLSATLNKGIELSSGKYISMIASDDIMAHNKIEVLVNEIEMQDTNCAVVFGDAQFIDDNGNKIFQKNNDRDYDRLIEYYISNREDLNITIQFCTYRSILKGNYIPALSTLIRKEALINVGLYDEDLCLEDWSMWLKLSRNYDVIFVNKVVAFYRSYEGNSTKTMGKQLSLDTIKILEREKKYNFKNSQHTIWRDRYYNSIIFLIKHGNYTEFAKKVLLNNVFQFIVYVFKRIIKSINRYE